MLDDPARGRLVVVRRDDEETVHADVVRLARQVDRVRRRVGARPCDHRRAPVQGVDGDAEELEAFVVRERGTLARRPGDDQAVRPVVDEMLGQLPEPLVVDRSVRVERRDDRG